MSEILSSPVKAHTPLPWHVCNSGECPCLTISCPDHPIAKVESGEWGDEYPAMRQVGASLDNKYEAYMERIAYGSINAETARANALLIVNAVNAHDALVHALEFFADGHNWMYGAGCDPNSSNFRGCQVAADALKLIRSPQETESVPND